jgi:UDPglucose 6-dehydrogenase/UDP-N-acetyl-D-galactosamine dehydrogenase
MKSKTVCVVGLGYVGLPLAEAFSKHLKVIGFDIDEEKIRNLHDENNNEEQNIEFTTDPSKINQADFVLICVPTPVTKSKEPDLSYVKSAAEIVGQQLKKGAIVVLESTIYPGVTEEIIAPILDLENESGLKCGADFKIGYSPERINPGDEAHSLDKITKIVAGTDKLFCKQKPLLKNIPIVFLLAQVFFCKKKKCVDIKGIFEGKEAKRKGFYYKNL